MTEHEHMGGSPWKPLPHERVLILAPHPDDEILAAGGFIAAMLSTYPDSLFRVVVTTNGNASHSSIISFGKGYSQRLGEKRQQESLDAGKLVGLDETDIVFWGFPDRGLDSIWHSHRVAKMSNNPQSFTRDRLLALLRMEFSEFHPTTVIMPHPQDAHPDHRTLTQAALVGIALQQAQTNHPAPKILAYITWGNKKQWHGESVFLSLSPRVREQKCLALQQYRSQKIAAFLPLRRARHRDAEEFFPLRPYSVR